MVRILLLFHLPSRLQANLGLIELSGILVRNTLILIGQIETNREEGPVPYRAVIEATVQHARRAILTALPAILAFVPLTQSVFWGSMAYTLIGEGAERSTRASGYGTSTATRPSQESCWTGWR